MSRVLEEVIATHDAWSKRFSTGVLNKWVKDLMVAMPVPRISGRAVNLKFMTQIKTRPPTFALFCNVKELPQSFHRFLRARMQRELNLEGVPVRFVVRKTQGKATERSLLRRSSAKKQVRFNNSSLPVGKKREKNKFLMVKKLREMRKGRRRKDKRAQGKARYH